MAKTSWRSPAPATRVNFTTPCSSARNFFTIASSRSVPRIKVCRCAASTGPANPDKPTAASPQDTYTVGDLVEVELTLTASEETWYVLLEDPIPAGFEVLRERMNPTRYGDIWCGFEGPCYPGLWYRWGYNRKNVYDDKVTFFMRSLWPGEHRYTYLMRAVTPGQYSVLPGEVYPMYVEELWGRTGSAQITVAPEVLAQRQALAGDFDRNCRVGDFDLRQAAGVWGKADATARHHRRWLGGFARSRRHRRPPGRGLRQ